MNPTEIIEVRLSATEWNTVLTLLSEGPYKLAAPLITSIQQQCMAHEQGKARHEGIGTGEYLDRRMKAAE